MLGKNHKLSAKLKLNSMVKRTVAHIENSLKAL